MDKKLYDEITRRVFEKSEKEKQDIDDQITIKALAEVSGLSVEEIDKISEKAKQESEEKKAERKRRRKTLLIFVSVITGILLLVFLPVFLGLKEMFSPGDGIVIADSRDQRAFMEAAAQGNIDMVTFLLDKGISVNTSYNGPQTALMEAVKNKQTETAKLLLERGADVTVVNNYGYTAVDLAHATGEKGLTSVIARAFAKAVPQGHPAIVLWENDIPFSVTGFMEAIAAGDDDAVSLFLDSDMYISKSGISGKTPLVFSVEEGKSGLVGRLCKTGDRIKMADADDAYEKAVERNDVQSMKHLTDWGVPVNGYRKNHPALVVAARQDHLEATRFLLENGANPNEPHYLGDTPLIDASSYEVLKLLLENGADKEINYQGSNGLTALHNEVYRLHTWHNNPEIKGKVKKNCILLLDYGADPTIVCYENDNAIDIVRMYGLIDFLETFKSYAAKL